MIDRDALLERLQPIVDHIFAQLADLVPDLVREQLGELVAKLAGGIEAPDSKRERKVAKRDVKRVNGPPTCGKCGESGHNRKTCGRAPKTRGGDPVELESEHTDAAPEAPPPYSSRPIRGHRSACSQADRGSQRHQHRSGGRSSRTAATRTTSCRL